MCVRKNNRRRRAGKLAGETSVSILEATSVQQQTIEENAAINEQPGEHAACRRQIMGTTEAPSAEDWKICCRGKGSIRSKGKEEKGENILEVSDSGESNSLSNAGRETGV